MKATDSKRAFVKKRSKVTASEVRKHVISGLLPIHRITEADNGFDMNISMLNKVSLSEPVAPIDVETLLEQRKTCLLYSISSPKSSKPIFEYVSDDVEVKTIRHDGLSDHNYTTVNNIENHVRDICSFYCDDFSIVNRKHQQLGTEDLRDRWNLEKLTALRTLRPQIFHSGLRIMDREPSTISLEGHSFDMVDPAKCQTEQFYVSMLKKSAIDKNTLLYSMLGKNRVKHMMNCITNEDKDLKFEKRCVPHLPEEEESPKLFVKVEKTLADPFFEPLFVSMAVYDIRHKQKVTESVYFNIVDADKLDMLGKFQPTSINKNLQALFNITGPISDMFLIIKIEKVLQQLDVFEGSDPYVGSKEDKNLDKLKSAAEDFCQRLGSYRTPLGYQVVDIQKIFNISVQSACASDRRTDPMISSSCTMNSGITLITNGQVMDDRCSITSADRTSLTSVGSTLRRFGSGTSAATVFSRVRTPLSKRKFNYTSPTPASSRNDYPDTLDNMPSCSLKFTTFFRQENDKLSDEDIYRVCNEVRKTNGKVNRKMFNFDLELTVAGSNKSKECRNHGSTLTLSTDSVIHEAVEIPKYKSSLNKSYKNYLYVYPKHINLSNRTGNARNIMIKVELMDSTENPQETIFEKGSTNRVLLKCSKTSVIYHNRTPFFTDEIKIQLPCDLNDGHHLLFTVYHVSCKETDVNATETAIGYTWLPLYRDAKLRSGDFNLPVCGEKPPASYGYLDSNNALPNLKWIDNHKPIFTCSLRVISSVHAQDDHLEKFFTGIASLSSTDPKHPPIGESELIHSIDNLLKAAPDRLFAFIHFILSRLIFLISNPPFSDEVSLKSFECIGHLVKLFSLMLDSDCDSYNRSMLLASFVKYRKVSSQESKPHSSIRPVELKASPTDSNLLSSMIEHVERSTHSVSNIGTTNVRFHENICEIWLRARGISRENSIVHSWFFLEIILKSASEYLTMTGRMFSSRKIRFGDQFLKNIETLCEIFAQEVITRHTIDFDEARMISNSLAFFLRDSLSIMDRSFVMKLIHKYMISFSEAMKKLPQTNDLLSIKIDFIRIICSYEHYLIINILNDAEISNESSGVAAPPKSSLTNNKNFKKSIATGWVMTDSARSTHYLSSQVLSDLKDSINSGNANLCAKSIETIKELFQSHELDNRLCEGESLSQVANIYKPLVIIVLDSFECLYSGSVRNSADASSNLSFLEQTSKQDVMSAISGRLRNSPDPSFAKLHLDMAMTKSLLCSMFWILKNVSRNELQCWLVSLDQDSMLKLLHVLYYTLSTFEMKEETPNPRHSLDKNSMNKLEEEPAAEVKWRTRSTDTCDSRNEQITTQEAVSSNAILSCEIFLCVVEIIDNIIASSADTKNSLFHVLPMVFPIIMHGLSCNVSDQVLEVLFAAQQSFFARFPAMILEQKPELCAELSQQILRHCSSTKLDNVRTMATVSLYHFLRENFKIYKNLTKARTFLSTALSTLLSGSCDIDASVNDEFMIKSLEIANQLAEEDDAFDENSKRKMIEQMKELTANLQKIMLSTVRMREHVNDYEMTIDLMYQLVEGYSNNPDLRITWLLNMAERHEKQRSLCESAHSYLQACALVFEYIDQRNQNMVFESKGASTFLEITPNAIKESKTTFNKNPEAECHIQSYHFTEAGLLKILEKSFSLLEKAQLYELLFPFSKIILNYCHAVKSFSRVAHIHKRLSVAADQIRETDEFYEYQSDSWVSPLPGIDKRCFGTFFRVAFYGKLFRELDNQEFVYKESAFSKLNEISNRLETFYTNMFGDGNVIVLKDSKQVEVSKLNPNKAYIQITFVDVFLSDDEKMERKTYFERRNNVNRFYFETPYTMEGRAQGDLSSQYKKRTVLTVENSFPYIKTRLKVINRSITNYSPIEVAIEDIEKKTRELAAAAKHKNPKMLSMLVQGSIGTTVNQGPLEIANVFLANSVTDERGRPMDRLQNKLRLSFRHLQYRAMEAIQLSRELIGEDQKEYQENVEANFHSFVTHLKPMLSREKNEITFSEFGKPTVV